MELKPPYRPAESSPGSQSDYTITVALNMIIDESGSSMEKACNPSIMYCIVERNRYKGIGLTSAPEIIRISRGFAG